MPLIEQPEDSPQNLREESVLGSFDFSQEEDILQLSDQLLVVYNELAERAQRINAWAEEQGIEARLRGRLDAAAERAQRHANQALLEVMTGRRSADFDAFIRTQDPIMLQNHMGKLFPAYASILKHLDTAMSYGCGLVPEFETQVRHTANEVVKTSLLHTLSYIKLFHQMLDRIEHGIPEWDEENGCEKELEPGEPTMSGYIASSAAAKAEEQQTDDLVAVRLLSDLFGEGQDWA